MRRAASAVLIAGVLGLVVSEWAARNLFGLGDPPLIVRHDTIDYLFKPGVYHRFGHRIAYNSASMRAREPRAARDPCEVRILALGDSVLNGGALTDHDELATTLLEVSLARALGRPVWVGNASGGDWAPGNLKAYVERYGLFDADAVVLVVNSPDLEQPMRFARDMGPEFPTRKPASALWEGLTRYLPAYLPALRPFTGSAAGGVQDEAARSQVAQDAPEAALGWLIDVARRAGAIVLVAHHKMRDEGSPLPPDDLRIGAEGRLRSLAAGGPAGYVDLGDALLAPGMADRAYRDLIHVTAHGQSLLADSLGTWLRPHLLARAAAAPDSCRPR